MKKKIISILSLVVLSFMIFQLVACGSGKTEGTAKTTNGEKKFIVGFDAEFPPFGSINEKGDYVGFDLDLAREVCKREGFEFVAQPIDWDSKDLELDSGNIDCIWNGFTMTGREEQYTWTIPYIDNSQVVVVNADSNAKEITDLKGMKVIVQSGSAAETAINDEENKELKDSFTSLETTPDYNTAFMNLETGVCDAILVDVSVANYHMKNKEGKYKALEKPFTTEQYAVGFKKGNTELRDIVEKDLKEMASDGTLLKIAENYKEDKIPDMLCIGK